MTNSIKSQVLAIVSDIENGKLREDCDGCAECGATLEKDDGSGLFCSECGNYSETFISGFDYIEGVLDVNWVLDSKREFLGARLMVAYGGPTIWIDTATNTVTGGWWGETYSSSWSRDEMGLDEACSEWFGCC